MRLLALATIVTTLATTLAAGADSPTPLDRELAAGQAETAPRQADWGQLLRYRDENLKLPAARANAPRVVFIGDSITESWNVADLASSRLEVLNRGIGGQTTAQILLRFRQDVVELKPAVVHILAGTNDFAGNTGPTTLEAIEDNLMSMAEIARANRIRVVLASVPPALDFPWRPGLEPSSRIVALNAWARAYARRRKLIYVDYYNALADLHDGIKSTLSDDGVHPNKAGYAVMTPLARQAISRALKSTPRPRATRDRGARSAGSPPSATTRAAGAGRNGSPTWWPRAPDRGGSG
jgi:lysophospholipase L1-like esterase